jgi:hypothetical protein
VIFLIKTDFIVGRFRLQQVAGRSGQPVEPRHGQHVARLKLVEQPANLR